MIMHPSTYLVQLSVKQIQCLIIIKFIMFLYVGTYDDGMVAIIPETDRQCWLKQYNSKLYHRLNSSM